MVRIASIKYIETDEGVTTKTSVLDASEVNLINLINVDSSVNNCDQIFYIDF